MHPSDECASCYEQTLRADTAETALREREHQLARVLQMADAWEETFPDGAIKAAMAAQSVRRAIRGLVVEPGGNGVDGCPDCTHGKPRALLLGACWVCGEPAVDDVTPCTLHGNDA